MRKRTRAAVLLLCLAVILALAGCTKSAEGENVSAVLYESDALRIEREGARTHIFDLIGNETYTFTAKRVKKSGADRAETARETTNTETVAIKTVYDLIVVTEKSSGKTLYVRGAS